MFGYVTANRQELSEEETNDYRSFYCGLCRELRSRYGFTGRLTLSYDMTFLVILLTYLYDTENRTESFRCPVHPVRLQQSVINRYTGYCADMNIIMTYLKCDDDVNDEGSLKGRLGKRAFEDAFNKAVRNNAAKTAMITDWMAKLNELERQESRDIDDLAGCFGHMMEVLFEPDEGEMFAEELRKIGFFLGKFIYISDAYEDVFKDIKSGSFNPFRERCRQDDFDDYVKQLLIMMMGECTREFERLPIVEGAGILRNILYNGIFTKYEMIRAKRSKHKEEA